MNKFIEKKKARAAQIKGELDSLRTLMDIAPQDKLEEHYQRAKELNVELRAVNADLSELMAESGFDSNGLDQNGQSERTRAVNAAGNGGIPDIVLSNARSQQGTQGQERTMTPDKVLFRSGESMATKYDTKGIDAEKCLRAAITGDYSQLNEAEKRSVTPSTGGAMLAPEVSSLVIDNLRKSDWMQILTPTIVLMGAGEVKIPEITALPTAVMHTPGTHEDSTDPTIGVATLKAQSLMCVVEVANELLSDAATSQGIILQAATEALSNKLLQQTMYGTGEAPELKGITLYNPIGFADAGDRSSVEEIHKLIMQAKIAILKKNGTMNAMLYDCELEERFLQYDANGAILGTHRVFEDLYKAGKVMPHPSIAAGDVLFLQNDALFLGIRQGLEIQVDPYSAFNSNNTKFRVIMRADIYANTSKMAYYHNIPASSSYTN